MTFVRALQPLLAKSDTLVSEDGLGNYLENCESIERTISAAVILRNEDTIPKILKLAEQLSETDDAFIVHAISSGNNWGYGSSLPSADHKNTLLVDLSELDKILFFDNTTGVITIQPGVTQEKLYQFLSENHYSFLVPTTGAGPTCSIIGNALERGYGITPYTDHFMAVNSIKGYLADGSIYRSALHDLDLTESRYIHRAFKWGIGPYLDGIFSQSGYGIVTEMSLQLKHIPECVESFFILLPENEQLEKATHLIYEILKKHEGIVGSINLMDLHRTISMKAVNPNLGKPQATLTETQEEEIRKREGLARWTIMGTIYNSKEVVKAVKRDIKRMLKSIRCRTLFTNDLRMKFIKGALSFFPFSSLSRPAEFLTTIKRAEKIMKGSPDRLALELAYWKNEIHREKTYNPAKDNCGVLWYAPLVRTEPKNVSKYVEMVRSICEKHSIDSFITITNFKQGLGDSTIPILYNKDDAQDVQNAKNCLRELTETGLSMGFIPYRLNVDQQQKLLDKNAPFWTAEAKIKQALDPHQVLNPGRYNPSYQHRKMDARS